jgi:DNA-binding MarR family transcriptional regulator
MTETIKQARLKVKGKSKVKAQEADELHVHDISVDEAEFDPITEGLWSRPGYLVRRLNQIHYALFFEECKEENITPVQYGILTVLSRNPWLDQTEIGYELGLDRTTSADVIKRLEEKGLLQRRVNPLDRRSRQAVITQEGLRVMALLQDGMARSQRRLLQPLSPRNQKIFLALLRELIDANNQYGRAALRAM